MNIRHLRIFKTVCEEKNITKASEKLFMTQPAVSHVISELEEELNVKLFDRISRRLYLNEVGKLFLTKVVTLLELYDDLGSSIKDLEMASLLRIGSTITIGNFILPEVIKRFENECSGSPISMIIDNAKEIENKLLDNQIDIALIEGIIHYEQFDSIEFSSYELVFICSPKNKFAQKGVLTIESLVKERLLLREKGSAIRDSFDSALLLHNISIDPVWTSVNSQALIQAVKENLGISILPKELVIDELRKGSLIEIHIKDLNLNVVNHIAFHKGKFHTKTFEKFIEIVKEYGSSMLKGRE